jgi:hypothetical protein
LVTLFSCFVVLAGFGAPGDSSLQQSLRQLEILVEVRAYIAPDFISNMETGQQSEARFHTAGDVNAGIHWGLRILLRGRGLPPAICTVGRNGSDLVEVARQLSLNGRTARTRDLAG